NNLFNKIKSYLQWRVASRSKRNSTIQSSLPINNRFKRVNSNNSNNQHIRMSRFQLKNKPSITDTAIQTSRNNNKNMEPKNKIQNLNKKRTRRISDMTNNRIGTMMDTIITIVININRDILSVELIPKKTMVIINSSTTNNINSSSMRGT